jgi:hypothetical protein
VPAMPDGAIGMLFDPDGGFGMLPEASSGAVDDGSIAKRMSSLDESACRAGINLADNSIPDGNNNTVGWGGGYGGFYYFALATPVVDSRFDDAAQWFRERFGKYSAVDRGQDEICAAQRVPAALALSSRRVEPTTTPPGGRRR